jgi:hypothetical protein
LKLQGLQTLAVAILVCAACDRAASDTGPGAAVGITEVRDSAGIRIVDNQLADGAVPRSIGQPLVRIGQVEGHPSYQLYRVDSAVRLADGRIVISNGGSELRFYDATGAHQLTTGRAGDGPGEYRSIRYMRSMRADSLLVYDGGRRRISIVSPDGTHVRDFAAPAVGEGVEGNVVVALADGTLLVTRTTNVPSRTVTRMQDTVHLAAIDPAGTAQRLGEYPGGDRQINISESGGEITSIEIVGLLFSRAMLTVASRDRFYVASNHSWQIDVRDGTGSLQSIVRRTDAIPQALNNELVSAEIERRLAQMREQAAANGGDVDLAGQRRRLEGMPRVESLPAYAAVTAVQGGGVWVREYVPPAAESETATWSVLDGSGALTMQVAMPAAFRPMYIDDDVVIGVIRDDLDVEYVHVYAVPSA